MTMPSEFDQALHISWLGDERSMVGQVDLSALWSIGGVLNGGLLMAVATHAAVDRCGREGQHRHPVAWNSQFPSAARPGPAQIAVSLIRQGRALTHVSVSISQEGAERVRTLVTLGNLADLGETVYAAPSPAPMPPPEQCIRSDRSVPAAKEVVLLDRLDLRLDPATAMWALGAPSREGRIRGWLRLADGRAIGVDTLPLLLDAMPPVAFDLGGQGWAPTVAFLGSVRAVPVDGWMRMEITTSTVVGGLLEEDATIWDSTGQVVAHSRQIAGFRMAREGIA